MLTHEGLNGSGWATSAVGIFIGIEWWYEYHVVLAAGPIPCPSVGFSILCNSGLGGTTLNRRMYKSRVLQTSFVDIGQEYKCHVRILLHSMNVFSIMCLSLGPC
jgi:hypothetical protein